jgi:N-acetylglucosamine repressor
MTKPSSKPQAVADLESTLLRVVCSREAVSRIELARELKLVPSTAGIYVDRLIQSGYLLEAPATARTLGRPPVLLKLNPQGGRFIGVDFDARQIMTVAVDFAQRPLEQVSRTIPARATVEGILQLIEESIAEVAGSRRRNLLGIGLGVPGPVDPLHGISREYPFIHGWRDVPVGPQIAARFSVPVFVENNLRSMALGELWCGEGRGLRDLVCLGIRSGIGSGIIIQGQLLQGANNLAGEIGRWTLSHDSAPPEATKSSPADTKAPRTIEDVASLTAILSEAARRIDAGEKTTLGKPGNLPTVAELLAASHASDHMALDLLTEAARVHAWIAHQLVQLLDPERIIVAGPLVESDAYLQTLRQAALSLGGPRFSGRIARSTLGAFAGAFGAAALAFHHWKPRR